MIEIDTGPKRRPVRRHKRKQDVVPYVVVGATLVGLVVLVGIVLLANTVQPKTFREGSVQDAQAAEKMRVWRTLAEMKMIGELSEIRSGGQILDELNWRTYYEDMSFDELSADYQAIFPARWHVMMKGLEEQ